jgi:hypothetical protein
MGLLEHIHRYGADVNVSMRPYQLKINDKDDQVIRQKLQIITLSVLEIICLAHSMWYSASTRPIRLRERLSSVYT